MTTPARRRWLAAACVAPWLLACTKRSFQAIDVSGADWGRDFRLRGADGREHTLADYRGRLVLVFFGFTQCPDICPTALARAAETIRLLGAEARLLQVIFVTIDPERDTPAVLGEYTRAFEPTFIGLWGDAAATEATAREFHVFYRKVQTGASYTMDHSAISYVFDTRGRLRLAVQHAQTAAALAADMQLLLDEAAA